MAAQINPGNRLKVAIVGGGIGGLSLAVGLLQNPNLDVQVYEGAHRFSEIGAGVAFGPNAGRALKLLSPDLFAVYDGMQTANGWGRYANTWFQYRFGEGPHMDKIVCDVHNETGQRSLHRAKFLDGVVTLVPKEISHFGKRLVSLEEGADGAVTLRFKDGTSAVADCVIGADGIHSPTRGHIFGADAEKYSPEFSGCVGYRGLVPMEKAREVLGDEIALNSHTLLGYNKAIMAYPVDNGKTLNMVAADFGVKSWEGAWQQSTDWHKLEEMFEGWSSIGRNYIKLLSSDDLMAWSLWALPPVPKYYKGKIAVMGDAAHATTPFQGQGAGQAVEDAFVLTRLFSKVKSVDQIEAAFAAYDRIRRPRAQRVVKYSQEAGDIVSLKQPDILDNAEALKEHLQWRMDWIWHRDIEGEAVEACTVFDKLVQGLIVIEDGELKQ